MRKILKRLRKGIKTACLSAALVTCWQAGQVAQAGLVDPPKWHDEVPVKFSGTISPTENDLSHLFLIYGTGYSAAILNYGVVKLGEFPAGQSTPFSVSATAVYDYDLYWYAAGLYGDISSEQYIEGTNGVTLGVDGSEGDPWESYFSLDEATVFTHLLNDGPENLPSHPAYWNGWHIDWSCWLGTSGTSALFDFSQASNNGQIYIESEVVPEPMTIILFGTGGIFVLCHRRSRD